MKRLVQKRVRRTSHFEIGFDINNCKTGSDPGPRCKPKEGEKKEGQKKEEDKKNSSTT